MAYDADNLPGLTLHGTDVAINQAPISRPLPRMASMPNPFHSVSALTVALDSKSAVSLSVHDIRGRLVRTLASGTLGAGVHGFVWDARDHSNRRVPAGLYIYRLSTGGKARSLKTILKE
jgi:flagellar hook assembly protein FlgD